MRSLAGLLGFLLVLTASVFAQDARPLRNADVIKMVKSKLQDSTIIMVIQSRPSDFDVSPDALISLKQAGVSTTVMEAMLQAGLKSAKPAPAPVASPPPTASPAKPPAVPVAMVPSGIWGGKQTRIEADRVFLMSGDNRTEMKYTRPGTRTRMGFGNQQYAVLGGPKARLRTENKTPEFEMILPNNVEVSSVVVLGLLAQRPNGSREILIGAAFVSATQGIPADRNMRVEHERVRDQSGAPEGYEIYRIRPVVQLQPGEYAFMVSRPAQGELGTHAGASINYNFYELGVD